MIDMHQNRRLAERRIWSGHVQQLLKTLNLGDRAASQDITESLAVFCQHHTHMSEHALALLMARSFCIVGDAAAAGQVLRHNRAHGAHTSSWLEVLSSDYPFPELYPLFSSRALRPQSLASAGDLWVLDFDKIQLTEADRHELILLQTVRVLTEQVSNVWKKSNGQGTLGIKGLLRLTQFVRGRPASHQLLDHICDVMVLRAQKNGWLSVPAVLLFDL